jgi:hypothetical protein
LSGHEDSDTVRTSAQVRVDLESALDDLERECRETGGGAYALIEERKRVTDCAYALALAIVRENRQPARTGGSPTGVLVGQSFSTVLASTVWEENLACQRAVERLAGWFDAQGAPEIAGKMLREAAGRIELRRHLTAHEDQLRLGRPS